MPPPGRRRRRHAKAEETTRLDSANITVPTRVVNSTMIGGMMFGRMWRHRMRLVEAPIDLRGMHVHVLAHRHYGGADNARAGNPQQQPERADDLRNAGAEHGKRRPAE